MNFDSLFSNKGLSLDRLRTLVLVADAGTLAKAAPDHPTRQGQFVRQLGELEAFFEIELRSKDNSGKYLNADGQRLADVARKSLQDLEAFLNHAKGRNTEIAIGAGDSILRWLVLPSISKVQERMPTANWMLHDLKSSDIGVRLLNGSIDFGLVRSSVLKKTLESIKLGEFGYRLYIPKKLLPKQQNPDLQSLLSNLPIATQGNDTRFRRDLEESVEKNGWILNAKLYAESFTQLAVALETGSFAAILPDIASKHLPENTTWSVSLDQLAPLKREIHLAWNPNIRKSRPIHKDAQRILQQELNF